jgi:hypothetical protein
MRTALTGRTHGCTDPQRDLKFLLANQEPSTHGTKRTKSISGPRAKGQRLTLSRHPVRLRMPPTPTVLETNSWQRSFDRSSSVKISVAGLGWRRSGALGVSDGPQRFRHSATGKYSDVTAEERTKGRHSSVRHRHPGRPPGLTFVILEATFHLSRGDGALTSQAWTHIGTRVG